MNVNVLRLSLFQEYLEAIKLFRDAYFTNTSSVDAIRNANIAFQSEKILRYNILKTVSLQANANNRNCSRNGRKKTYFFRLEGDSNET